MLASVSFKYPGISWNKHHQTSLLWKIVCFQPSKHEISAVVYIYLSLYPVPQHLTYLLQMVELFETPATCSYTQ